MKKFSLATFVFTMLIGMVFSFNIALAQNSQGNDPQGNMPMMEKGRNDGGMMMQGMDMPMMGKDKDDGGRMMQGANMPMMQGMDMPMCSMMMMGGGGRMMRGMTQGMDMMKMMDMPMSSMPMMRAYMMSYADKLQLTQDQKDKISSMMVTLKKDMIRKNADLEIAKVDLEELVMNDEPDLTAIGNQLKNVANMEADIKLTHIKAMVDMKAVLTKEQKDKLKAMMMEHMGAMGMPMGRMEQKGWSKEKSGETGTKGMPEMERKSEMERK